MDGYDIGVDWAQPGNDLSLLQVTMVFDLLHEARYIQIAKWVGDSLFAEVWECELKQVLGVKSLEVDVIYQIADISFSIIGKTQDGTCIIKREDNPT